MSLVDTARQIRKMLEIQSDTITDAQAATVPDMLPAWSGDGVEYKNGKRVSYEGKVYKCLSPESHVSQADWTPTAAVSLWAEVLIPTDAGGNQTAIPEWVQPESTNPYSSGDMVTYNGKTYRSRTDSNVWNPTAYPAGWEEVTDASL